MARKMIAELTQGVDDTGIRAGIIGEIGAHGSFLTAQEERVLRAAARAQRMRTGDASREWTAMRQRTFFASICALVTVVLLTAAACTTTTMQPTTTTAPSTTSTTTTTVLATTTTNDDSRPGHVDDYDQPRGDNDHDDHATGYVDDDQLNDDHDRIGDDHDGRV